MIRWITPDLGTGARDDAAAISGVSILDVRDLVDRDGNAAATVKAKIDLGLKELAAGRSVLVCCDYGISRSNAIAAGILALRESIDLDAAIVRIVAATDEDSIKLELLSAVRAALGDSRARGSGRTVLVTGGSGFVGKRLVGKLRQMLGGDRVVAPGRDELDLERSASVLDGIVRAAEVEALVHLAHPRVLTSNRAIGASVAMLKNVLDVCADAGVYLLYVSSWEVFSGYPQPFVRANEDLPRRPRGSYGYSKALCETLIEEFSQQKEVAYGLLRSGPVFGSGGDRPRFVRTFVEHAVVGEPIVVHRYRNERPMLDLMHVDDMVEAISSAVTTGATGIFHVGRGRGVTTLAVAERAVAVLDSTSRIDTVEIDAVVGNIVMDTDKTRNRLAWEPRVPVDQALDEWIRQLAESFDGGSARRA